MYCCVKLLAYSCGYTQVASLKAILAPASSSSVTTGNEQQEQSFETKQPAMKKG